MLTPLGISQNLTPQEARYSEAIVLILYIFSAVLTFSLMIRTTLVSKTKELGRSIVQVKETSQKLLQSEKMASLGVLSASVAHEINNPLNFIHGGIEILEIDLKKEKLALSHEDAINVVKDGIERISTIVQSLNQFSRDTDEMTEKCDINQILSNVLVVLQSKLKYKSVETLFDEKEAIVIGNSGKLHQVFLNIIAKAEYAVGENGKIELSTVVTPQKVSVAIKDNGCGISPEHLQKINDPFFTTKPVGEGTGLGLAIAHGIIADHKGEVNVSSNLGKGTTFEIHLPIISS